MSKIKKILSGMMTFCLVLGIIGFLRPVKAEAASSWQGSCGKVTVTNLDGDFKDGKYRFNVKITYDKQAYKEDNSYDISITNIRLVNSKGKVVATWKDKEDLLEKGGTVTRRFSIDFSNYASDTYTFKYTVNSLDWGSVTASKSYYTSVSHSAGSIKYSSSKYVYDTDGTKKLQAIFNIKMLNGYTPKVQVYNADGKLIKTFSKCGKVNADNCNYKITWKMYDNNDNRIKKGSYTIKITVNGKSCCKKFTLDPN